MRILLIDDSPAYHEEFAELLQAGGFSSAVLDTFCDAEAGWRRLSEEAHDIYFVDYRLPGDSGITLIERARRRGVDRPIILLTGFDNPAIDQAAEQAGANDYLPKGAFSAEMLSRAIRYARRNAADLRVAREAERRFRLAQEAADIGTWDHDIHSQTTLWSPRQRAMFDLDPDDRAPVSEAEWHDAIHPDDRAAVVAAAAEGIARIAPFETLFRVMRPAAVPGAQPSVRWLAGKGMVLADAAGRPARALGVTVDVTSQQTALADLQASRNTVVDELYVSENRFQTYFDSAVHWLFDMRVMPDGRFVYEAINPAALAYGSMGAQSAKGRTPEEVLGPQIGRAISDALHEVCATGAPYTHEICFDTPAGKVTYEAVYQPLRDRDGGISGVLGSAHDISERRRLEESLRQSQKMETLGQLAGGVSHDFNNILQSISSCLELALDDVPPDTRAHDFLAMALRSAKRGSDLTHHLLSYARKQLLRPQSVAVPALLHEVEMLLAHTLGPAITVMTQLGEDLPEIHADASQLQTALVNLAINASHAMPSGGVLVVNADTIKEDDRLWVAVSVTDTGSGMDEATLTRAVEPFFTTKGPKGTGLGLSMVQGFVAQSGGRFHIRSAPGMGTTVELLLPIATAVAKAPARQQWRESLCILLVEDDDDTRIALATCLEEAGFVVKCAANGDQALAILDQGARIDAIVSDFAMKRLNGADMIAHARDEHPDMPAMLISGWAALMETRCPGAAFLTLHKPFERAALIAALDGLLRGHRTLKQASKLVS